MMRIVVAAAFAACLGQSALAQTYDPGASATEVKLGQSGPYSGPVSAYAIIPRTQVAYFQMLNDKGGINGRKVSLLSLDDAYSPPKAVEAHRRLIEQDQVLAIFGTLGTPSNAAVQTYLNQRKVPQVIYSGASRFVDPAKFPWTISFYPSYELEGAIFGKYVLKEKPDAKIGILYQNDDSGRDFITGFKRGLGDRAAAMIVSEVSYVTSDTTVSSQVSQLKAAGADTVFNAGTPRATAQSIKAMADISWKPLHLVTSPSSSVKSVIEPAGAANAIGLVTAAFMKTAGDPEWANDADVKDYEAFVKKYVPEGQASDFNVGIGYLTASIMADVIKRAGDNLTRKNILDLATSIPPTVFPLMLPGIRVETKPGSYETYNLVRLQRFDGSKYVLVD